MALLGCDVLSSCCTDHEAACAQVGKTLTAEATAEHLQRPLYTLTSGELGTTPTELEENLAQALASCPARPPCMSDQHE